MQFSRRLLFLLELALKDDRAELAFDADEIARAFREADAFEPGAGEADLGDFATCGARALACARAEPARGDVAPARWQANARGRRCRWTLRAMRCAGGL